MTPVYSEPELAVLVLDYCKPIESRMCLESVRHHLKVPHAVIFCDNGSGEDYALDFVRDGLVDQLIVNRSSRGLGLGTRDLFALSFARWTLYLQNDQVFARDLDRWEFDTMVALVGGHNGRGETIQSISLAGSPCGPGIYSERAHLIATRVYKEWEERHALGHHGAGPYHDGRWREEIIQHEYGLSQSIHLPWPQPIVADNGVYAVRGMGEGGLWCHRTDTKQLFCIVPPVKCNPAYPRFTPEERELAEGGKWPDGRIPALEAGNSFNCWGNTELARKQDLYIADLRRRKGNP